MTKRLALVPLQPAEPPKPARSSIAKAAASKDTPERPYEVRATTPQGLLLRVQPSGARTFYVQIGRGKRVKIGPAGTYTLKQAEERAKKILLDPDAHQKHSGDAVTLGDYLDHHYAEYAAARLKNGTKAVARVKTVWKSLLKKRVIDIRASDVDTIRNKRLLAGATPGTVNRDVSALSGALSHWATERKGRVNPLHGLSALEVADDETVRYLTPEEVKRLRQALKDRDDAARQERATANAWRRERGYEELPEIGLYSDHITPLCLLTMNTGLRRGEAFSLAWEDVSLERKTLTIRASNAKTTATRHIPLNAEALSVLEAIKPEAASGLVFRSPVTGKRLDNINKAWDSVRTAAKLGDFRWHDLRHHFASTLVMRGVPLYSVQKLLGHANSRMTQRYARLAPHTLAEAVEVLTP